MKHTTILNCEFGCVTLAETTEWTSDWIKTGKTGYICTVNVAILMIMRNDPKLRRFIENAALVVADGQPIVWASRLKSQTLPERVTGVDLVETLCAQAEKEQFGVYFLGARPAVVQSVVDRLRERYPNLRVSGHGDGYFGPDEALERARSVAKSGARLLFVGMGVPRQEEFLADYWSELGVNLALPVGGSFEIVAGTKKRAPAGLQRIGAEWLYRLCQEPRRLFRRYLITNTQFLFCLLREIATSRWRAPSQKTTANEENNGSSTA